MALTGAGEGVTVTGMTEAGGVGAGAGCVDFGGANEYGVAGIV